MRFFFFKQKTAYELRISDWSSDVCSSDLLFEWQLAEASNGWLFDQPLIAAQFEESLMVSLLGTLPHNQAQAPLRAIAPGYVKRAEAYIEHQDRKSVV